MQSREGGGAQVIGPAPDPTFVNCSFIGNESGTEGGAIHLQDGPGGATLINCLFAENTSGTHGGAVDASDAVAEFINCTFFGNSAAVGGQAPGGGGIYAETNAVITVTNSILWDNFPDQIKLVDSAVATVTFSDVDGGYPGGNINLDPDFVDPLGLDFRLLDGSPCIDVGNDAALPFDGGDVDDDGITGEILPWDLDALARIFDDDVDMGAYENQPPPACPWDCDGSGDGVVGIVDFLALLAQWGSVGSSCDFGVGDPGVGINEFLDLLGHWGVCPCPLAPPPLTLQQELDDACLTQDDWDDYTDVMTDPNSPSFKKLRYDCWMRYHLFECPACSCNHALCPGADPFN